MSYSQWRFWIDRGGTFTDVVAISPDGHWQPVKLLSENPGQYTDAAVEGIRRLMDVVQGEPVPGDRIAEIKMGTTVATNALLERKGAPTILVVTAGFEDALEIGYQARPEIFALNIQLPEPIYGRVVAVDERMDAGGEVIRPVDLSALKTDLEQARRDGFEAVAIACLHSYRNPESERAIADLAREVGFPQITLSSETSPLIKWVERGQTAVIDAYLSPVLGRYVDQLSQGLLGEEADRYALAGKLLFMQSHGGLAAAERFRGKDAVLSGPAGGVVGMSKTAEAAGFERLIGFDMGGTSTDVCHFSGEYERSEKTQLAGHWLRTPLMSVHTVAAGGGSMLGFDGFRLTVGPESAGASPGPVAYGSGGPLAVTDCNVLLGKIRPEYFPRLFGDTGDQPLDVDAVSQAFEERCREVREATGREYTPQSLAEGYLDIAVENMVKAIRKISVERGYDVERYTLNCFGGAGAQHACLVANSLGMDSILINPYAGVLSALGMGLADRRLVLPLAVGKPFDAAGRDGALKALDEVDRQLAEEARAQHLTPDEAQVQHRAALRVAGSDFATNIDWADQDTMLEDFWTAQERAYGFSDRSQSVWVDQVTSEWVWPGERLEADWQAAETTEAETKVELYTQGEWRTVPVYWRESLALEPPRAGPALILEPNSTILVEPGWQFALLKTGDLHLTRIESEAREAKSEERESATEVSPVTLELFNNRFMAIAEQMGVVLERTSASVNIKERLDFSCALFTRDGDLIANAPHIPVHLGSMSDSVRSVLRQYGNELADGDAYLLNSPYDGGTHLPDITVMRPVFLSGDKLEFFVAARGHHADVGGKTPGSMPAFSYNIDEEGVLIPARRLVRAGEFLKQDVTRWLTEGEHPVRNLDQNMADLTAQLAACERGVQELRNLAAEQGEPRVLAYADHVLDFAEECVTRLLQRLESGRWSCEMDDGTRIQVAVDIDQKQGKAVIDFAGTAGLHPSNFNAPSSVARAAVLYTLRCLIDEPIPLNEGFLRGLDIRIPENSLISPTYPAAVVAGNVETSQYLVDSLLAALGQLAGSQGTNNNLTFGNNRHQYYETICGGSGAGDGFNGASGVQVHMTNSRLTDPEVLESRFPIRVEHFGFRNGSGGGGRWHGGNGVIRRLRFLEPMTVSMLSGHRKAPVAGIHGGEDGACGINRVIRADGSSEDLPGCVELDLDAEDAFEVHTPGGGGFGHRSV
jgi:5-oxoprolinase (ATP-hydrolysing)